MTDDRKAMKREVTCPLCDECCPTVAHFIYAHLMDISDASRKWAEVYGR